MPGDSIKRKKKRCRVCKKKLGLHMYICRCSKIYCKKHLFPEEHQCLFDYKKFCRGKLEKENPRITLDKIIKI